MSKTRKLRHKNPYAFRRYARLMSSMTEEESFLYDVKRLTYPELSIEERESELTGRHMTSAIVDGAAHGPEHRA